MKNNVVKITRDLKAPENEGHHYRVLCLTGENKGVSYFIKGDRAVMGRGDEADVQVLDTKSSREHAEFKKVGTKYTITDLGSQNGVIVNDLKITQHQLKDGDKIIIGRTVFKYSVIRNKPKRKRVSEEEEVEEESPKEVSSAKAKKSKKRFYILIAVLGLVYLMLTDTETKKPVAKKAKDVVDITNSLNSVYREQKKIDDKDTREKVETFIHRGRREYREGNYFRAIEQLNLCLILAPGHGYCSFLLSKSEQRFNEMIKLYFEKAKIDVDALKYNAALVEYCAVVRLLNEKKKAGKKDERLEEAEKNIEYVEKKIGMEPGEYKCF